METKLANLLIDGAINSLDKAVENLKLTNNELFGNYQENKTIPIHLINQIQKQIDDIQKQLNIIARTRTIK